MIFFTLPIEIALWSIPLLMCDVQQVFLTDFFFIEIQQKSEK